MGSIFLLTSILAQVHRICYLQNAASDIPELAATMKTIPPVPLDLLLKSMVFCRYKMSAISDLLESSVVYLSPIVQACFGSEELDARSGRNMYGRHAVAGRSSSVVDLYNSLPYVINWDMRTSGKLDFQAMKTFLQKDDLCKVFKCLKVRKWG